jgi:hypothetical protein
VKRYSRAELVAFLRRLDALLTERAVLEVVGGAAAVLKYGARAPTKDIDTWNRVPKAVQDAADAIAAMGHGVPLAPAGVAEIPNDAELRFKTVSIQGPAGALVPSSKLEPRHCFSRGHHRRRPRSDARPHCRRARRLGDKRKRRTM